MTRLHIALFAACQVALFVAPGVARARQVADTVTVSLVQCETLALQNNPLLHASRLQLERAEVRKAQADHAALLPSFEIRQIVTAAPRARAVFTDTGVLTSPDTATGISDLRLLTEMELNLLQPLYTFGKFSALREAAAFGVDADQARVEGTAAQILLITRQLYWGLLLSKELNALIENTRRDVAQAEEKLQELLDEGSEDVTQNDLFKLRIFQYELNKRHREVLKQRTLTATHLRASLGFDDGTEIETDVDYLDPVPIRLDSLPQYIALAHRFRPELQQLRAGITASQAMVRAAASDYYPQFFLAGGLKYNYAPARDDPRNPWVYNPTNFLRPALLLGARLNLNFIQTRDRYRLAEANYRELAFKEHLLLRQIELEVREKYLTVVEAQKNIQESSRALKASESWLRSVSMTFDLGLAEVKELIDAFRANGTMQAEHLQNIFRFNSAVAELSKAVGTDILR